jgi:hypothetical protein
MSTNTPPLVVRVDGNSGSTKDPALLQPVDVDFDDASAKSPVLSDLHGVESFQSQHTPATRSTSRLARISTPQLSKEKDIKSPTRTPTQNTVGLDPLSTVSH